VPTMLQSLLKGTGLTLQQLQYAVHPGGPKILDVLADALGVKHEQLKVSWEVLNQVGNSSGSSNLCLLHRELAHKRLSPGDIALPEHLMCIGIGPGLSIEAVLVKRIERTDPLAPDMSNLRMTSLLNRSVRSSALMTRPCSQVRNQAVFSCRVGVPRPSREGDFLHPF